MSEKMNFDLDDLKKVFDKIFKEASEGIKAQKEECKCKKDGPDSLENRVMALEAKQDLIIEDLNRLNEKLEKSGCCILGECHCKDDENEDESYDSETIWALISLIMDNLRESLDEDDAEDYPDESIKDVLRNVASIITKNLKGSPLVLVYNGKGYFYTRFGLKE